MGAYLSRPNTTKRTTSTANDRLVAATTSMQGWRRTMEDGDILIQDLYEYCVEKPQDAAIENPLSFFAVLDGHGGDEVARFSALYLHQLVANHPGLLTGDYNTVLADAFHMIDVMIDIEPHQSLISMFRDASPGNDHELFHSDAASKHILSTAQIQEFVAQYLAAKNHKHIEASQPLSTTSENQQESSQQHGQESKDSHEHDGAASVDALCPTEDDETSYKGLDAGSTVVSSIITKNEIVVAWAGDSRGVYYDGIMAVPLSADHKPENEVETERIVKANGTVQRMAGGHYRINGNLNVSRALGDKRYKTNTKISPAEQIITAQPDFKKVQWCWDEEEGPYYRNRFVILACDGVWDVMTNEAAADFVDKRLCDRKIGFYADKACPQSDAEIKEALGKITEELLDACVSPDPKITSGIGCDNMTVILILLK